MAARCEKYDLPAEMCAHCTGAEERARAGDHGQILPGSPWFRAAYPGRCSGPCGEEFLPGDKIRADGHGTYACEQCGAAAVLEELF